jgi:uncharacterized protein YjbJ (UPF0337 family)
MPSRVAKDKASDAQFRESGNIDARWNLMSSDAFSTAEQISKGTVMDKEHIKGAADKAKGAIKDAAGKVTGDKELQAEGKMDKAKGAAHSAAGDVKDAVKKAAN